jgi:putative peptidoglycan lipid II flippase
MPMTFLFFYFGDIIIKLVFERGKFLAESTTITYTALMCYTVSLVFYSAYSVLNKIFYSIKLAKYLLAITIVGIIIKLAFNFILVGEYHQYGLAVSTTISYLFFFIMSYLVLNKKLKIKNKSLFIKEFLIHFINCSISLLTASIISDILSSSSIFRELVTILLFLLLYLLNLVLINHKAIVFLNQVLQQLNFKIYAQST